MRDPLSDYRRRRENAVVGLNCGTSLDGVDAALVIVKGRDLDVETRLEVFHTEPMPEGLRSRLDDMASARAAEVGELNLALGELFERATRELLQRCDGRRADLIGVHGVTLHHRPPRRRNERGTSLQIGDPALLVEAFECPVVSDFRAADVAAGGQGAPLMPWLDFLAFRREPGTIALNLGGMANLTWVGETLEDTVAFDTGPANMPLDLVATKLSGGKQRYDAGGRRAREGTVDAIFLDRLMGEPYLTLAPPKSTGREEFGKEWVERLLARHGHLKLVDILATLTAFVAQSIRRACDDYLGSRSLRRVVVSGGGVRNLTLIDHLRRAFAPVAVVSSAEHGIDPDAKEAILFAALAHARIHGAPSNVPSATGAKWPVRLGRVAW